MKAILSVRVSLMMLCEVVVPSGGDHGAEEQLGDI